MRRIYTLLALFFGYHEMWVYIFPVYFIFYGFLSSLQKSLEPRGKLLV